MQVRNIRRIAALAALGWSGVAVSSPTSSDSWGAGVVAASRYARAVAAQVLEVFQVAPPVLTVTPNGTLEITDGSSTGSVAVVKSNKPTCQDVLVVHSFAYSYGKPYVGQYSPPSCAFDRVSWNLTVTSAGVQFDRLGSVFLGNIEVFRTSTAEPTTNGIEWTYIKDMTAYLSLFKTNQKLIFDLGNLIDSTYTGAYNVTLTAAYFTAQDSIAPADLILPVSSGMAAENQPSMFSLPSQVASNDLTLPRNVKRAVFTLAATGQIGEEFWWSNVLQSDIDTYPESGALYGYSPFREVQLYIDGMLAGVAWPFPIIFTGGVSPGLWRPIVGIDAFDLKEDEVDITPFLPLLCDGQAHNFTIKVSGLNDDGHGHATLAETTGSYWLVTGKVFVWLDKEGHVTTGSGPHVLSGPPSFKTSSTITKFANGTNDTLIYSVNGQRRLSIFSSLELSNGPQLASWNQNLGYTSFGNYTEGGNVETNEQKTTGFDWSSSGYARSFSYPLYAFTAYATPGNNISIVATVNRTKSVQTFGQGVFPTGLESFSTAQGLSQDFVQFQGTSFSTTEGGTATYFADQDTGYGYSFGSTTQDMDFSGLRIGGGQGSNGGFPSISGTQELFRRHVVAVNSTVTQDQETLLGRTIGHAHGGGGYKPDVHSFATAHVPGRGRVWQGQETIGSSP